MSEEIQSAGLIRRGCALTVWQQQLSAALLALSPVATARLWVAVSWVILYSAQLSAGQPARLLGRQFRLAGCLPLVLR